MRRFLTAIVLVVVALGAVAEAAPEGRRAARRDALREKVRAVRMARLVDALQLDAAEAARLSPILDRGYDEIARVARESAVVRRELRALVATAQPDSARIDQLIDLLVGHRARIDQLQLEMLRGVRQVMSPRQAGRLVLVLPQIERQLQQQIRRAAQQNGAADPAPLDEE